MILMHQVGYKINKIHFLQANISSLKFFIKQLSTYKLLSWLI